MLEAIGQAISKFQLYFGGGAAAALYLLCLYILWRRKREAQGSIALISAAALLFFALFPLTAWVSMKVSEIGMYWRICWIFPLFALVPYVFTLEAGEGKKKRERALIAVFLALLIALTGTFVFSRDNFSKRGNNFKMDADVIYVADAVNRHAEEHDVGIKKIVAPDLIATYIRTYDATIRSRYGRDVVRNYKHRSKLYYEINAEEHDYKLLAKRARISRCNYVILTQDSDSGKDMRALGYERAAETGRYVIYYDPSVDPAEED